MDDSRLSKQQILERLHTEHDRLIATVMALSPAQRIEPDVVGWWSVREVMAHLTYWTRFPVQEIQAALEGRAFDYPEFADEDAENAAAIVPYQYSAMDEVLAAFERAFGEIVQFVGSLPDRAFEPGGEVEQRLGDTIADALNSNTYDHYALHRGQIETWYQTVSPR